MYDTNVLFESSNVNAIKNSYITFYLGEEEYGIEIIKVKEIVGMMKITSVPNSPTYIKGVLNLRGKIIPIIDLRLKFGMEFLEYHKQTPIIIVEIQDSITTLLIGIVIDSVSDILELDKNNVEPPPSFGIKVNTDCILGMGKVDDEVKILLNIDKVLTSQEINLISQMKQVHLN